MVKKVVVAIDSYKGCATSAELNAAVKQGIAQYNPQISVTCQAIADGGEGSMQAIYEALGGEFIQVATVDLLNRPITANYLLSQDIAVIEVAEVVGIDKIIPSMDTIQRASTFGLAALLLDALKRKVREIIICLGGSGTSDGGMGLLAGLGVKGADLMAFSQLDFSEMADFSQVQLTILSDVTNPYAGRSGFSMIFGPQKGGNPTYLSQQAQQAQRIVDFLKQTQGIDLQQIPGTGAAGGLGGALVLLGGKITPGFQKISELTQLATHIAGADLVITGEGKMDAQTAFGKVPFGVAQIAKQYQVPTIALCGALGEDLGQMSEVLLASFSIHSQLIPLAQAMDKDYTLTQITRQAQMVCRVFFR